MIIDPEFQALVPPLTPEERQNLAASVTSEGCRDALVVWRDVLIDGHNRYEICIGAGISFDVVEREFESRDDAKVWIIKNQFGRRNLPAYERARLALQLEKLFRVKAQENLSIAGAKAAPGKPCQNSDKVSLVDTKRELAAVAGVSHDTIAKVKKIEQVATPEVKEQLRSGDTSINQVYTQIRREEKESTREARREENRQKVAETPVIESGAKFATIVIDPPWDWGDEGDADQLGRARPTYGTMKFDELLALPVGDMADLDCHLYLWITNRSLPKGFALMEQWGFRYVTCVTWCKPSFGMGNYFRGSTEHILFGVRGSQPLKRKDVGTWFEARRGPGGHSSKPVESYDLIESCSPGPYLEMFARSERGGWVSWGADANGATP